MIVGYRRMKSLVKIAFNHAEQCARKKRTEYKDISISHFWAALLGPTLKGAPIRIHALAETEFCKECFDRIADLQRRTIREIPTGIQKGVFRLRRPCSTRVLKRDRIQFKGVVSAWDMFGDEGQDQEVSYSARAMGGTA
jgi:hypothetical protein